MSHVSPSEEQTSMQQIFQQAPRRPHSIHTMSMMPSRLLCSSILDIRRTETILFPW